MSEEIENRNQPTEKELDEARRRAREKLADDIVAKEFGTDAEIPRKGPLPKKERMFSIKIELPPGAGRGSNTGPISAITIDGKIYQHGGTYTVPESVFAMMRETIWRMWDHQREVEGKDRNAYRREKNVTINPVNVDSHIMQSQRVLRG